MRLKRAPLAHCFLAPALRSENPAPPRTRETPYMTEPPSPRSGYADAAVAGGAAAAVQLGLLALGSALSKVDPTTLLLVLLPWSLLAGLVIFISRRWLRTRGSKNIHSATDPAAELLASLGIDTSLAPRLRGSLFEPRKCIKQTSREIDFLGIMASKWVLDPPTRVELDQLLSHFDIDNGRARFLVMNPSSPAFAELERLRSGGLSMDPIRHLANLQEKHVSLEVRLYNTLPIFRYIAIDRTATAVAAYEIDDAGNSRLDHGWEAPHVRLDPAAPRALSHTFERYFEELWKSCDRLGSVESLPATDLDETGSMT